METKKHLITMILALIAMCMGTQVMAQTQSLIAEKDWTGGFESEYPYWYQYGDGQEGTVSSDPNGVAINVGSQTGNRWQPQIMVINNSIRLKMGGNYKVVVTAKFPCDGAFEINLGSWSGNDQYTCDVVSTGGFQEVEISFPDYPYDCIDSGGKGEAHVLLYCGDFLGTTIVKKVQVLEIDPEPYVVFSSINESLTFYYDAKKASREGEGIEMYDLNTGDTRPGWFDNRENIKRASFDRSFKGARPVSTYMWFYGMKNLQSINGLHYLNTSKVTNMASMFNQCSSLTELDLSNFDTEDVTTMNFIFGECTNLKTIYVGDGWKVDQLSLSDKLFYECVSIEGGQGTTFNPVIVNNTWARVDGGTSSPGYLTASPTGYAVFTDNTLTFYDDGKMEYKSDPYLLNLIDELPDWETVKPAIEKVVFDKSFATTEPVTMCYWFGGCNRLTEIEGIKNLNTSKVKSMACMFQGCQKLTTLDLSSFNTSNVTNMTMMFYDCSNLENLNLNCFDTSNVTGMTLMFNGCKKLESLNLGSFNTGHVLYMTFMFQNCEKLKTIYVGNEWSTGFLENSYGMFFNCNQLKGENGTTYSNANTNDFTFAHIDEEGNPGYLSYIELYNLWIDGVQVTSINKNNAGGGSFSYDSSANKLSINESYSSNSSNDIINNAIPGLTIYIPTNVTLSSSEEVSIIKTSQPLWVTGPGYLTCTCPELGCGIDVSEGSTLRITNANLVIQCGYGLSGYFNNTTDESLVVANSNVQINSSECAIGLFKGGISLQDCKITTPAVWKVDANGCIRTGDSYAKEIVITKDYSISTDIDDSLRDSVKGQRDSWYTIDGKKLNGKPAKKGVYINNGKAVVN